jgi:glycosyltransferase involved in cell wall biosynthesis|tara:strand:+ start:221 stop:1090 length:870 start_codon:yes stop_codon:yes gene_type:complete
MKFSIIVPSYNNIEYLKLFLKSIKTNSNFKHQIVIHVNQGIDGTLKYLKTNNIDFTHSKENIGLCDSVNLASKKAISDYIMYAHDDMFFCKDWDLILKAEIKSLNTKNFYLSGLNISNKGGGFYDVDCGTEPKNFNIQKFNEFCKTDNSNDLQGSHWAPHVVHKDLWIDVGGFSREFNPGDGSDPDFCLKLWKKNVRIFKTIANFKVYHFGSVTIRKNKNIIKNKGTQKFILKWGFSPKFFRKYYLQGNNLNKYNGFLNEPIKNNKMLLDLFINKCKFFYLKIITLFNK